MKYLIAIILLVFISIESNSQDSTKLDYQRIYYCEEIEDISDFLREFLSCTNPQELQKYIVFPDFKASHKCGGTYDIRGIRPFDSTKIYMTDLEIKEMLDKEGCTNPLHYLQIKFGENKVWRDSLNRNNIKNYGNLQVYCFVSEEYRLKYLQWFINEYHFPIDTDSLNFRNARITDKQFSPKQNWEIQVLSLIISYFGYHSIEIYKLNGEYKVKGVYVGHD